MDSQFCHADSDYIWLQDRGGGTLKMQRFHGELYFPWYKPSILQGIKEVKLRPDDIYLATYLRTGTHWAFEMISMLLSQKAQTIQINKEKSQLEYEPHESLDILPSPRIISSHMPFPETPKELVEKKCKIIFTLRDPKDVAVSQYHIYSDFLTDYKGKFADFLYLFLEGKVDCGGLFKHWRFADEFFDKHPQHPVHFMAYEDTIANPVLAVQRLSDFIGMSRNDTLCQEIAEQCHITKMREDKTFTAQLASPLTYRKGVVGDWRNYFTEQMLEDYYRVYEEKMAGSMFYQRYAREEQS